MCILKDDGKKLNIRNFLGRNNFKCLYNRNCVADDRFLPCSIEINNDNWDLIRTFIKDNPAVNAEDFKDIEDVRRVHVGAACPYWSPVIGKGWFGGDKLEDSKKHFYKGLENVDYFYHERKKGCNYYEQFKGYIEADVLIFNSKKYEIENLLNRKPETEVEIIDECDEFLDKLGNEKRINLNLMMKKLGETAGVTGDAEIKEALIEIHNLAEEISKSKWMDEIVETGEVVKIEDTKVSRLFNVILNNEFILEHEELETYYSTAKSFKGMMEDSYVSFYRNAKGSVILRVVNVNLERRLKEFIDKNKVFVMMSGTLHSEKVLRDVFGINEYKVIEAETQHGGIVKKLFTGLEKNYRYREFKEGRVTRRDFLESLNSCVENAEKPFLVHVQSYEDLPSNLEKEETGVSIMSRERLIELQDKYKKGELLQWFKEGKMNVLYSTRCNRGIDLPGDVCKSIIFTRYPFPAMQDIFWKVLQKKNSAIFREFYFDKSRREFMQRIYRGLRSNDDAVNLMSPDIMVMNKGNV